MFHIVTSVRCDKCGKFAPWSLSSRTETKRAEVLKLVTDRGWHTWSKSAGEDSRHYCPECKGG